MICILIRQVIDYRHRTPKSLAVADIEPMLELGALTASAGLEGQTMWLCVRLGGRDPALGCGDSVGNTSRTAVNAQRFGSGTVRRPQWTTN